MLTDRKRKFIDARLSGLSTKDSAIKSGCPEKSAAAAGSRLEKDIDVIAHKKRILAERGVEIEEKKVKEKPEKAEKETIDFNESVERMYDPKLVLEEIMTNKEEDPRLRATIALGLMPYHYQKLGDTGKKEEKKNKAGEVAKGKFGAGVAPNLKVVN